MRFLRKFSLLSDFKLLIQISLICVLISIDSTVLSYGLRRQFYTWQELRNDVRCPESRGQFGHPKYCDRYLNCWDDEFVVQKCPGSLVFNDKIKACDWPKNVDCSSKEDSPPPPASGPVNSEPVVTSTTGRPTWKPKPSPPFGQVKPDGGQPEEATTAAPFKPGPTVSFRPKPQHQPNTERPTNQPSLPPFVEPSEPEQTTVATLNPGQAGGGNKPTLKPTRPPTDADPGFFPNFPSWPSLKCPIPQGILPVKDHCDTVVVCLSGVGHLMRCPHGHNFDRVLGTCSSSRVGDEQCQSTPLWHERLINRSPSLSSSSNPQVQFVYVPQAVFTSI